MWFHCNWLEVFEFDDCTFPVCLVFNTDAVTNCLVLHVHCSDAGPCQASCGLASLPGATEEAAGGETGEGER